MERLAPRDLRAVIGVLSELEASESIDAFARQAMLRLQAIVPFDVATYNEVDVPRNRALVLTEPTNGLPIDAYQRFEPLMHQHPIIQYLHQTNETRPLRFSDLVSQRQLHQLGLYQDFFRVFGLEHQIALRLPAPAPLIVGIALNRARPDFSERERLLLDLLRPQLLHVYRQSEVRALLGDTLAALERALAADNRAIVLLLRGGRQPLLSSLAREWFSRYFGRPLRRSEPLPTEVESWLARQRVRHDVDDGQPPTNALEVQRADQRLRIRYLPAAGARSVEALLLEESRLEHTTTDAPGALTAREAQVLELLTAGLSNGQIARTLDASERTVQKHLEHVYRKLGVQSRTAAMAWAVARRPASDA